MYREPFGRHFKFRFISLVVEVGMGQDVFYTHQSQVVSKSL